MHVAPPPSEKHAKVLEKCSKLLLRKLHTWPKLNRQIILQYFNDYVPSLKVRDFKISKFLTSNFSFQIRSANFACVCSLVLLHICSFQGPRIVHLLESKTQLLAFHCCSPRRKRPDLPPGAMSNAVPTATLPFLRLVVSQCFKFCNAMREPQRKQKKESQDHIGRACQPAQLLWFTAGSVQTLSPVSGAGSAWRRRPGNSKLSFTVRQTQSSKARSRSSPLQLNRVQLGDNSDETAENIPMQPQWHVWKITGGKSSNISFPATKIPAQVGCTGQVHLERAESGHKALKIHLRPSVLLYSPCCAVVLSSNNTWPRTKQKKQATPACHELFSPNQHG